MCDNAGNPVPSACSRAEQTRWNNTIKCLLELRIETHSARERDQLVIEITEGLRHFGYPKDSIVEIVGATRKRKRGAPPSKRLLYLEAFTLMLESPAMSLGKVTNKLCDCGANTHNVSCRQRFQTGIRGVKTALRTHVPELISTYDSLHPDRKR